MTKYFSLYWIVNKTKFRAQILPDAENWGPKIASERERKRKRKWSFNPLSSSKPVLSIPQSVLKFWFYKGQEKGQKTLLSSKFTPAWTESLDFHLFLETEGKVTPKCQAPKSKYNTIQRLSTCKEISAPYSCSSHLQSKQSRKAEGVAQTIFSSWIKPALKGDRFEKENFYWVTKGAAQFYHHVLFAQHMMLQPNVLETILLPSYAFPFSAKYRVQVSNYKYFFFFFFAISLSSK